MAIAITAEKNSLATKYAQDAAYCALFTANPGTTGSATNEVTGGSYARVAISWGAASNGVIVGTATLNVPSGVTITHAAACASGVAGTADLKDVYDITDVSYAAGAGTYAITITYTQT